MGRAPALPHHPEHLVDRDRQQGRVRVGMFGPTVAARYGLAAPDGPAVDLQGFPGCPVRRPTAITEQQCWWQARCPFTTGGPPCLAELGVGAVATAVHRAFARG